MELESIFMNRHVLAVLIADWICQELNITSGGSKR